MLNNKSIKYLQFVEKLYFKCQEIQNENERHVHRIIVMKRMIKQRKKDVSLLKDRLDRHNDNWRQIPLTTRTPKELKKGSKLKNNKYEPKVRRKKAKLQQSSIKTV